MIKFREAYRNNITLRVLVRSVALAIAFVALSYVTVRFAPACDRPHARTIIVGGMLVGGCSAVRR